MLPTATNERRILAAARQKLGRRNLIAFYEHGQWWVESPKTFAQWSVVETSDGFDFEEVTRGEDE